jgi:MoxR-like ATPase
MATPTSSARLLEGPQELFDIWRVVRHRDEMDPSAEAENRIDQAALAVMDSLEQLGLSIDDLDASDSDCAKWQQIVRTARALEDIDEHDDPHMEYLDRMAELYPPDGEGALPFFRQLPSQPNDDPVGR